MFIAQVDIAMTTKKRYIVQPYCIYSIVLICTRTEVCLAPVNVAAPHGCMRVYIHGDNWLEPRRADGIVMTSASTAHSDAIGSTITWNGTCLLVLS